jgi:hypothetical protein
MSFLHQQFVRNKQSWSLSSKLGMAVDVEGNNIPWFSYSAIDFLQKYCQQRQNLVVFEFGSGSSTLFFQRQKYHTFSLETSKIWFNIITQKLALICCGVWQENYFTNQQATVFLLENAYQNAKYYQFLPQNFSWQQQFDIILVDSLHRLQCVLHSINFLKPDGLLIVDDFERKNYHKISQHLLNNNFYQHNFIDLAVGQLKIKNTALFTKKLLI